MRSMAIRAESSARLMDGVIAFNVVRQIERVAIGPEGGKRGPNKPQQGGGTNTRSVNPYDNSVSHNTFPRLIVSPGGVSLKCGKRVGGLRVYLVSTVGVIGGERDEGGIA